MGQNLSAHSVAALSNSGDRPASPPRSARLASRSCPGRRLRSCPVTLGATAGRHLQPWRPPCLAAEEPPPRLHVSSTAVAPTTAAKPPKASQAATDDAQTLGSEAALCEEDEKHIWPLNGGSRDAKSTRRRG